MDISLFTLFLAALIGIGFLPLARSERSYLFAGRATPLIALTATLVMTEFNSSTLLAFSSIGYSCGLWALYLVPDRKVRNHVQKYV